MPDPLNWLTQLLGGGDPEAQGAAQASTAMQPSVYDMLQDRLRGLQNTYTDTRRLASTVGNYLAQAPGAAIDYAGNEVARPFLQQQEALMNRDWSQQPLIGTGERGELTGRIPALASMVTPYLAGGAPGGTLSSGTRLPRRTGEVSAPYIGKGTDSPLFDISRLDEVPNVPQVSMPRRGYKSSEVPSYVTRIAEPANLDRMDELAKIGRNLGGMGWYNTFPMRERWREFLGQEVGDPVFDRMMAYQSALSNNQKVPMQIRTASLFHAMNEQGRPRNLNPVLTEGRWKISPEERAATLPPGYGSIVPSHEFNMRSIEAGQPPWYYTDPLQNPKPPSYLQNFLGNYRPFTIDQHIAHAADLRGPWKKDKKTGLLLPGTLQDTPGLAYPFMEEVFGPRASNLDMAPAQWQASVWLPWTGVKSPIEPFVTTFENRVRAAAARRGGGETPEQALRKFIEASRYQDPLEVSLWSGGAPLGTVPDDTGGSGRR